MPSLYLLYHLDGRTVVRKFLKLEVKVVQPGDELRLRRVTSDDDELLAEDTFDDKTAPVMLQSDLTKQLVEADILLFIEAERVFITRYSSLASSEAKDPPPKIRNDDSDKLLAGGLGPGRFRVQYYNRREPKKSPANGLERSWADISSEAFYPVVYCGRKEFFIIRILEFIAL